MRPYAPAASTRSRNADRERPFSSDTPRVLGCRVGNWGRSTGRHVGLEARRVPVTRLERHNSLLKRRAACLMLQRTSQCVFARTMERASENRPTECDGADPVPPGSAGNGVPFVLDWAAWPCPVRMRSHPSRFGDVLARITSAIPSCHGLQQRLGQPSAAECLRETHTS